MNWVLQGSVQLSVNVGDWYRYLTMPILPSNIPLSEIFTPNIMDSVNGTMAILGAIRQKGYVNYLSILNHANQIYNMSTISIVNIISPQHITFIKDITMSFIYETTKNFNGTLRIFGDYEVDSSNKLIAYNNTAISNFDIRNTADPSWVENRNGIVMSITTNTFSEIPPINYLDTYWYIWLVLIIGGGFMIYFLTLRTNCKVEMEGNHNWTCPKPKNKGYKKVNQ